MKDHKAESIAYVLAAGILLPFVYYSLQYLTAGGWLVAGPRSIIAGTAIAVCGVFCWFLLKAYFRFYDCEVPTA